METIETPKTLVSSALVIAEHVLREHGYVPDPLAPWMWIKAGAAFVFGITNQPQQTLCLWALKAQERENAVGLLNLNHAKLSEIGPWIRERDI